LPAWAGVAAALLKLRYAAAFGTSSRSSAERWSAAT